MTNRERLEEIKKQVNYKEWFEGYHLDVDDIEWLIKQAARVEELELEIDGWRAEVQKWQKFYKESEESHLETKELLKSIVNQSERYRKAINNIIEKAMFGTNEEVNDAILDALKAKEV